MHFLLKLLGPLSFLIVTATTTSLALVGLFFVRRKYSPEQLKENHEVAAIIFSAFGWLYAVILAFVVFVTWTGYDEANKNMQLEASQALEIFNNAEAFPEPLRNDIRQGVILYVDTVANQELPNMASENLALYSASSLHQLNHLLVTIDPNLVRNSELYGASLRRLDDLMEYRRLRIFSDRNNVPGLIWLVLLVGSVIMVANTYFFGMRRLRVQAFMIAALTVTLTLVLYLVFVLDHPFTGRNRVSDAPLREVLALMHEKMAANSTNR